MSKLQSRDWESFNFENDPRQKLNKAMWPYIDIVYRSVFGERIFINRIDHIADYILDRRFAIDTIITFPSGHILTGQEKCLDTKFMTLTVEYMQDPIAKERGDWFNLAAQFYFCGYARKDRNGFSDWIIADWPMLVIMTNLDKVQWRENSNLNGHAKASFKYVKFSEIPDTCLIAKKTK